jgi:virulence-associated protein VapD
VTKRPATERCRWCGRELPEPARTGRPRRYCRAGCRQQAHLARRFAAAHGLGDDELIVERQRFEELQDLVYCLQAAIEDTDADLAGTPSAQELRSAVNWLLDNARPVAALRIEPKAGPG